MNAVLTVYSPQPRNTSEMLAALQQARDASLDVDEQLRREPGVVVTGPITIGMPAEAVDVLIAELTVSIARETALVASEKVVAAQGALLAAYRREVTKLKAFAVVSLVVGAAAAVVALLAAL